MELKEIAERMRDGRLYYSNDERLLKIQLACMENVYDYNLTRPLEQDKRAALLEKIFAEIGKNFFLAPPYTLRKRLFARFVGSEARHGTVAFASTLRTHPSGAEYAERNYRISNF